MSEIHSRNVNIEHWISKDYMQSKHSWLRSSANCKLWICLFFFFYHFSRNDFFLWLYRIRFVGFNMHMAQCLYIFGTLTHLRSKYHCAMKKWMIQFHVTNSHLLLAMSFLHSFWCVLHVFITILRFIVVGKWGGWDSWQCVLRKNWYFRIPNHTYEW